MNEHPTDFELTAYARGTLTPGDLLRVDDHLAACAVCRRTAVEAFGIGQRLASTMSALHRDLQPATGPQARVLAFRAAATSHIRRRGLLYAAAAVVMIFANVIWSTRTRLEPGAPAIARQTPAPSDGPPDTLLRDERALVNLAVATGNMPASAALAPLAAASGRLMSGTTPTLAALGPRQPVGVVVDTDRPTLEWGASDPNARYRVAVFDEGFQQVAVSPWLIESRWTVAAPLARGKVYTWQVTARAGGRDTTAPAPPQPEAKFMVTTLDNSERIAALRKRADASHLALAVLLAREGLLDEAERELALAPPSNAVTQLRKSLSQMRQP